MHIKGVFFLQIIIDLIIQTTLISRSTFNALKLPRDEAENT